MSKFLRCVSMDTDSMFDHLRDRREVNPASRFWARSTNHFPFSGLDSDNRREIDRSSKRARSGLVSRSDGLTFVAFAILMPFSKSSIFTGGEMNYRDKSTEMVWHRHTTFCTTTFLRDNKHSLSHFASNLIKVLLTKSDKNSNLINPWKSAVSQFESEKSL